MEEFMYNAHKTKVERMIHDLNLDSENDSFDYACFKMAVENDDEIITTDDVIEKVWKKYKTYQHLYHTPTPSEQLQKCYDLIKLEQEEAGSSSS
eukprot:UN30898